MQIKSIHIFKAMKRRENMSEHNATHVLFRAAAPNYINSTTTLKVAREFSQGRPSLARSANPVGIGGGSEKTSPPLDRVFTWAVGVGEDGTN